MEKTSTDATKTRKHNVYNFVYCSIIDAKTQIVHDLQMFGLLSVRDKDTAS